MILLIICMFITFVVFCQDRDKSDFFLFISGTFFLFSIFSYFIFDYNEFKLSSPKKVETFKENIYSLNNGQQMISGSFALGSGSINSSASYTYFVQNTDGSKERKSISSDGTKIFEGYDKPYFEEVTCKDGLEYSIIYGFFTSSEDTEHTDNKCTSKLERKLFVPKNTVFLDFSIK